MWQFNEKYSASILSRDRKRPMAEKLSSVKLVSFSIHEYYVLNSILNGGTQGIICSLFLVPLSKLVCLLCTPEKQRRAWKGGGEAGVIVTINLTTHTVP